MTTLFHLDDIERLWPTAAATFHYVHIDVSPSVNVVFKRARELPIVIREFDGAIGARIADKIAGLTKCERGRINVRKTKPENFSPADYPADEFHLVAPRVWNRFPDTLKKQEHIAQIPYDIDPSDAADLRRKFSQFCTACA